jgi:threonine synthase
MSDPSSGPVTWQVCPRCGGTRLMEFPSSDCPACGGLLEVRSAPPALRGAQLGELFASRRSSRSAPDVSGVWRFREIVLPGVSDPITGPEGNTPLLARRSVSDWTGIAGLLLKHEGQNPTGSFKDRGMTVGVTVALRQGATAVACASTGNTSASLAAYGALAGLPALVFVPAGHVAAGKLAQTLAYGARTLLVRGDFDACFRLVRQASEKLGVALLNSVNPYRIEGQKTIVFEMLEQLSWDPPDWIVLPAGNLGNTAAFGKALREAIDVGLVRRVPRLAAIQAEGASPFAQSFREGFSRRRAVRAETVATAIRIGDPASFDRAIVSIRATEGIVASVTDDEILEAKAVVDASGAGCEPASAASVAGARKLAREGVLRPGDRVVAVLTGHILKDPGLLLRYHAETDPPPPRANPPVEIEPSLSAVEAALRRNP